MSSDSSRLKSNFHLDPSMIDDSDRNNTSSSSLPPSRRLRRGKMPIFSIVAMFVLVGGVIAAVAAAQTSLDLRQWAWGGITGNQAALQGQGISLANMQAISDENKEAVKLFTDLTTTYYDADVANIDIPEFQVKGVVFKKFDPDLDQTIVFARLTNLPLIQAIPRLWLQDGNLYLQAGVGQLTLEDGVPVGYFMTSLEGNASSFKTLHFSYDETIDQARPTAPFLSLDFDEPAMEVQQ